MAIVLPNSIRSQIERPHGTNDALWLLELELDRGTASRPPVILRICDGQERLEWPLGASPATFWEPFPFLFSPIEQTQEGDLSSISITIDNSARTLMRWLHEAHGLEGNRATLFLVYRNGLTIAHPDHEYQRLDLEVIGAGADDNVVTFQIGAPNWFEIMSPTERYVPNRCRNLFGSSRCGYVVNSFAAFGTCPKTYAACVARAADMAARGLPPVLPGNHRGYPGISTQR